MNEKIKALAEYLEEDDLDLIWETAYDDCVFEHGSQMYLVLEDDEADHRCREYIEESVWSFAPWFILNYVPEGVDEELISHIQEKAEDGNVVIKRLIIDFDEFVEDAISSNGRGSLLNHYDGEEIESGEFFIYRTC